MISINDLKLCRSLRVKCCQRLPVGTKTSLRICLECFNFDLQKINTREHACMPKTNVSFLIFIKKKQNTHLKIRHQLNNVIQFLQKEEPLPEIFTCNVCTYFGRMSEKFTSDKVTRNPIFFGFTIKGKGIPNSFNVVLR